MWEILYPAIVDADDLVHCATLIKWLRVASTSTRLANNGTGPSAVLLELQAPLVDQALIAHRLNLLKQVLPALYQPAETLETALAQMVAGVVQNTNDSRVVREEKHARDLAPKLPSKNTT